MAMGHRQNSNRQIPRTRITGSRPSLASKKGSVLPGPSREEEEIL